MRLPIKLNAGSLPQALRGPLRAMEDPRVLLRTDADGGAFARAVSALKFGRTFKSTARQRFPQTITHLAELRFAAAPVILDVGASDGSTSLDVMQAVSFSRYYCTDLNVEAAVTERGPWTYFYGPDGRPILAVCDRWIAYNDATDAPRLLVPICDAIFARAPHPDKTESRRIALVNPQLRARLGEAVEFCRYNALEPWPGERANLVIAANVLNRNYFSATELERILGQLHAALAPEAYLALIENRHAERASLIWVDGTRTRVQARVGAGAEIEPLALRVLTAGTGA